MRASLTDLHRLLFSLPPGEITDPLPVEYALADAWSSFRLTGPHGGMTAGKIPRRLESLA